LKLNVFKLDFDLSENMPYMVAMDMSNQLYVFTIDYVAMTCKNI